LFELLAERMEATFYFFSRGSETYLGPSIQHAPGAFPVGSARRITLAGHPLLVGLEGELRRDRYDAVVKCINGRMMVPYTYRLARRRGLPFVLWTGVWHHPQTLAHRLTRSLTEDIYCGADAIVTYGEHVRRFVEAVPGVAPGKTYVAGQAIDSTPFSAVKPGFAEPAEILFVGQLEAHKGIHDLLTAFANVPHEGARLRLAGSGSLVEEVRARAQVDPRIDVLGAIPHAGLPAEFARARCLVLPSVTTDRFREAWGLVVNEAMAAGLPVIATDAVGAAAGGLVRNGQNGLVVPEGRPAALAAAISRLVWNVSVARMLGAQARSDVTAFDYPRMADAFVNAVDHAIVARHQRAQAFGAGLTAGETGAPCGS
jgi:glycosyltransferase involved in cell wall biosynthesis